MLTTADTLHNVPCNGTLSDIMLLIVTLDTENLYTPKKGLYWLRKGTRQLVALKSDEDLASCRREYGHKVPLKIACECIASPSPGKKLFSLRFIACKQSNLVSSTVIQRLTNYKAEVCRS